MSEVYTLADLKSWLTGDMPARNGAFLGVIGDPVGHSRSPEMQNAALAAMRLTGRYVRLQISSSELAEALAVCAELGFRGVNLTVPHKVAAFSLVKEVSSFAQEVGALNTIRFDGSTLRGSNTDGPGFELAIRESFGVELRDRQVLVLGAGGGAGRAIAAQSARAGCARLFLANRDQAKAETVAAGTGAAVVPWQPESLGEAVRQCDLIVQATPLGLRPNDLSPLPRELLTPRHLVYDLNYQPTALLAEARAAGGQAASGLTMLLHQGALAFTLWFDRPAPLAAMRATLFA